LEIADLETFLSNGQCALALLIGFIGGCFASWTQGRGPAELAGDE
jgi:hypothetical protein